MPHAFGVFRFAVFVALALGRAAMTAVVGTAVVGTAGPRRRATLTLPVRLLDPAGEGGA
jgi:hypothetical protein